MSSSHTTSSIEEYGRRAPGYDAGNNGWHITLGTDFARWIAPQPGEYALDLACGTGLVTIPLASAIGPGGKVVGIDLTPRMLAEARKKPIHEYSAPITWLQGDVTSLSSTPEIQPILSCRGGFDIISLCSALVLLPDQSAAIKYWAQLLRPPGRMIIDVLAENKSLQYIFSVDLCNAVGLGMPYDRSWVKDIHSLEKFYADAGLEIVESFPQEVDGLRHTYDADQAMEVFEEQTRDKYKIFAETGRLEGERKLWPDLCNKNLKDGKLFDENKLYITIGKKPL